MQSCKLESHPGMLPSVFPQFVRHTLEVEQIVVLHRAARLVFRSSQRMDEFAFVCC